MKLSILIPCYNEAATIEAVVGKVLAASLPQGWNKEVIVIDDGSTVATHDALLRLQKTYPSVVVLFRERNGGKGAALKTGLARASGDYLVIQDADLEYDPNDLAKLLAPLIEHRADSVMGSRNLGTNNVRLSSTYFYGGLLVTKMFNLLFASRFSDLATCYKVFPRSYAPALQQAPHDDFAFDCVDLPLVMMRSGKVAEVAISYRARAKKDGKKLNWKHGFLIVAGIFFARIGVHTARAQRAAWRIVRFLVSGASAALINIVVLYGLVEYAQVWYVTASVIAYLAAFIANFTMQKYWVFENTDVHAIRRQFPLYFATNLFNLILNTSLLYGLVEYAHLWYVLAQVCTSALIALESFVVYRWIFE